MRAAAAALLALAAAIPACVTDPWADPVPGREVRVVLRPGDGPFTGRWPDAYRRGARFRVENRTEGPVEGLLLDFSGEGAPRELLEAVVEDPPGRAAAVLPPEGGYYSVRALLGEPGTVLLAPGESLLLRVRVDGSPGRSTAKFTVR